MIVQLVLAERVEDETTPRTIVCGSLVENDRGERLDVGDGDCLRMKGGAGLGGVGLAQFRLLVRKVGGLTKTCSFDCTETLSLVGTQTCGIRIGNACRLRRLNSALGSVAGGHRGRRRRSRVGGRKVAGA